MATPARTQKQIAERYKGNLGYYKRKHPWRVARFCASFLALAGGAAGIFVYQKLIFQERVSEEFFNSGKISSNHAEYASKCAACHDKTAAFGHEITLAKFKTIVNDRFHRGIDFTSIDLRCQKCHEENPRFEQERKKYDLHELNVVENRSCSVCHQEHLGPGRMERVADWQCASCHNNRGVMEASAEKGRRISPALFHPRPHPAQQVVRELRRPAQGYTEVFASFDEKHPEFQLVREKARDPDVLRFNHQRHFAADIPQVNKQKLDCNSCHQPDPEGRFYLRISFAANCQACHALQFDKNNPQLHIPHGDVNLVRTFLRTLEAQYAAFAYTRKEKNRSGDVKTFAAQQMNQLRAQFGTDDQVERAVFFEKDPYKPQREMPARTRANFAGCAFCHDVKLDATATPVITPSILVDRWMPQARFNHAKHVSVRCVECHRDARESHETSDVLMPAKASCVVCHSPKTKKVASDCITCHNYHAPPQTVTAVKVQADARGPVKDLLLGSNH